MSLDGFHKIPKKELKFVKFEASRIGAALQNRRKELGFTQESFAEHLDISPITIRFIEQGRRMPSLPMLIRICRGLRVNVVFEKADGQV